MESGHGFAHLRHDHSHEHDHSALAEADPCHRAIHHGDLEACDHQHISLKEEECSLCDVLISHNTTVEHQDISFVLVLSILGQQEFPSEPECSLQFSKPSRAPPALA